MTPPVHLIPADQLAAGHGVARYAADVAAAAGAEVADPSLFPETGDPTRVHAHATDRLFGGSAPAAAAYLVALAARSRLTVTLHDVPQPSDGARFAERAGAWAEVLRAAEAWVANSRHEAALVAEHLPGAPPPAAVVPLPVTRLPRPADDADGADGAGREPGAAPAVVGILGWLYPGKGHAEVVRACAGLDVVVRALGAASPGHADLLDELAVLAAEVGVGFEATGFVPDVDLAAAMAAVDVPVWAPRHVSASASLTTWLGAGRRPLVVDGRYTREMAELRPGTMRLMPDTPAGLAVAVREALADVGSTRLPLHVDLRPDVDDAAAAYLRFWAQR